MGESPGKPHAPPRPVRGYLARWWREVPRIEGSARRILTAAAGLSLLLCLRTYLPFFDPFFVPPFPAAESRAWNLFAFVQHPAWSAGVFAAGALAGVALLLGRHQRSAPVVGLLVCSGIAVAGRPLISTSLTVMILLLLYLALFPSGKSSEHERGLAVFGLRLQVMLIYLCGSLFKLADPAWLLGYPLGGALLGGNWSSAVGESLARSLPPGILNFGGQMILGMELVLPIAALVCFPIRVIRIPAALLMMALHAGMALFMTLEFFPFVMIALWTSYLDGEFIEGCRARVRGLRGKLGARTREAAALLCILVTLYACIGQVFLPAIGHDTDLVDRQLRPINRQLRFNQHWGMFTHSSFELGSDRTEPLRRHVAYRLLVKCEDGSFWDPFRGRKSSLRHAYSEGPKHLHAGRKGLSYCVKADKSTRDRGLRSFASWAIERASRSGLSPSFVMIYRYSKTLDARQQGPRTPEKVEARLWYRFEVIDRQVGDGRQYHPKSVPAHWFET